jgi:hypothetical protein
MFNLFARKSTGSVSATPNVENEPVPFPTSVEVSVPNVQEPSALGATIDSIAATLTISGTDEQITDLAATAEAERIAESLDALISSIPAKILHEYTVSHLRNASPPTLFALSTFFSALSPPELLHCVRCHKEYFEVENSDRSCLVAHDDDSAEVERVGAGKARASGKAGAGYETLWGCCGKVTEGDGSEGPPDGWCYEVGFESLLDL